MTLDDYARFYAFRAASITMSRHISPRLRFHVLNAANSNSRASLPAQAGADLTLSSPVGPNSFALSFHDKGFTA